MRAYFFKLSFLIFFFIFAQPSWAEKKDCSCPQISCGPCQKKVSTGKLVKFCDWGEMNVCRKEICENVTNFFSCISDYSEEKREKKEEVAEFLELPYEEGQPKIKKKSKKERSLASKSDALSKGNTKGLIETQGLIEAENDSRVMTGVEYSEKIVAHVVQSATSLQLYHRGQNQKLKAKQPLFVGDEITSTTDQNEKLSISFENGQVNLELLPKTKIVVEDPYSILGHFQPFLYLVYGGVDFTAELTAGSFDLLAGQILARAYSGQFKIHYEMGLEGLQVKAENLKGQLEVIPAGDLSGQTIAVQEGAFLNWVSEISGQLFSQNEKQALVSAGFITPVFLTPSPTLLKKDPSPEAPKTQKESPFLRGLANLGEDFCQTPSAQFQQCSWSCEGNKKGSAHCQAGRDNVSCVRRICNAAGQWGAPTAFATSYKDLCPAQGVRVGDCSP